MLIWYLYECIGYAYCPSQLSSCIISWLYNMHSSFMFAYKLWLSEVNNHIPSYIYTRKWVNMIKIRFRSLVQFSLGDGGVIFI